MREKVRTNVVLDKELWRKTRSIALERETSASQLMNDLLEKFIKEDRGKLK